MIDASRLGLFVMAALVLTVTPGPAVLYIVTRSISQGRLAGVVSCLGVALGGTVHVLAAVLGLSAVLVSSPAAFAGLKYAGAAYLIWLGIRRARQAPAAGPSVAPRAPLSRVFGEGFVVNVLNPKVALFFLAFLPQFVTASRGAVPLQLATLGGLFLLIALTTDTTWSLAAGSAGVWLRENPRFSSIERFVSGTVYVGLGVAAAMSGRR